MLGRLRGGGTSTQCVVCLCLFALSPASLVIVREGVLFSSFGVLLSWLISGSLSFWLARLSLVRFAASLPPLLPLAG